MNLVPEEFFTDESCLRIGEELFANWKQASGRWALGQLLVFGTRDRCARSSDMGEVGEEEHLVEFGRTAGPVA